jgi:lysozyme
MFRLTGPHVNSSPGGIPEFVQEWRPAVATVLDPGPVWRGPALGTKTKFVWRYFDANEPDWNQGLDPAAEARAWVARHLDRMLQLSGCGGYFQGNNERVISSAEAMGRYAAFEAERLALLDRYALRGGVGSFAVGTPELELWDAFHPALEACVRYGGVLLLHEYNYPTLQGDAQHLPEWLSLRHRMVYARLPARLRVKLIITESGRDSIFGEGDGGWRGKMSPAAYLASLAWYDAELMRDPYVLGACVYCVAAESWQWSWYDIWPDVAQRVAAESDPLYRTVTPVVGERPRGVDVSTWQGAPDWKRAASSGIRFVLARSSVGQWADAQWQRNQVEAPRYGLGLEPYHFMTPDDPPAVQAAIYVASGVRGYPTAWVDLETDKTHGNRGPTEAQAREMVDRLLQAGVKPGIYTSASMWRRLGMQNWTEAYRLPLWVADWNPAYLGKPRLPGGWATWQYQQTTSIGSVPGIAGRVDLDIAN